MSPDATLPIQAPLSVTSALPEMPVTWAPLAPIHGVFRRERKAIVEFFIKTTASRAHPLEDTTLLQPGPYGIIVASCADTTTQARGVRPEDAACIAQRTLIKQLTELTVQGEVPSLPKLMRLLHQALREWLIERNGIVGIAQTIAVLFPSGEVVSITIGDTQAVIYRRAGLLRGSKIIPLASCISTGRDTRLQSALGQANGPLRIELTTARLNKGDILLLASDGGLPASEGKESSTIKRLFDAYAREKSNGLADLARLGEALDSRAQRLLPYDDDRTILILEKLS